MVSTMTTVPPPVHSRVINEKKKKKTSGGNQPWESRHTEILTRHMVRTLLASRSTWYRLPGLVGKVDGHGGNRISQKVIEGCKKLAKEMGVNPEMVQEEIGGKKEAGKSTHLKGRGKGVDGEGKGEGEGKRCRAEQGDNERAAGKKVKKEDLEKVKAE